MKKNIFVFIASGFEEIEAITIVDVLRRAQLPVVVVALGAENKGEDTRLVTGSHGIAVQADTGFSDAFPKPEDTDITTIGALVLPGGMPGSRNLRDHVGLGILLRRAAESGAVLLGAICAAPTVLAHHGLLAGHKYTCFPGFEKEITEGHHQQTRVVLSKKILTGNGPGSALVFSLSLVAQLGSPETARNLGQRMGVSD